MFAGSSRYPYIFSLLTAGCFLLFSFGYSLVRLNEQKKDLPSSVTTTNPLSSRINFEQRLIPVDVSFENWGMSPR